MKLTPLIRNNVCMNAHPLGCARDTNSQIERARSRKEAYTRLKGPQAVLVIGASTGYGLASRITAAFGFGCPTVGVSYERAATETKTGTPGWYNNRAFDEAAASEGLKSRSIDIDAFSAAAKASVIAAAREMGIRFDLVVYSIASPVRTDPDTGALYRSVIKPIGGVYRGKNVDVFTGEISNSEVEPANEEEIAQTVKVMGGEDWELWIEALRQAKVLAEAASTVAYSYIGPPHSWPIYHDGTIGRAKAHLEATAARLTASSPDGLRAFVSINKALVTRASAVIPVIPLYVSTLFKVMKERGIHEDCLDQIDRLFRERLYTTAGREGVPLDQGGRIRLDELEMGQAVQAEVESRLARITRNNLAELADLGGFRSDFLRVHGFAVEGVDYDAEVDGLGTTLPGSAHRVPAPAPRPPASGAGGAAGETTRCCA